MCETGSGTIGHALKGIGTDGLDHKAVHYFAVIRFLKTVSQTLRGAMKDTLFYFQK